jgi:hypothetical protein
MRVELWICCFLMLHFQVHIHLYAQASFMLQKSQGIWLRKFVEARWQSFEECESEGRKKRERAREMIAPVRSMERTKDQGARRDARRDFWLPLRSGSRTMIWQIHHHISSLWSLCSPGGAQQGTERPHSLGKNLQEKHWVDVVTMYGGDV